jgi:hypothetical protein
MKSMYIMGFGLGLAVLTGCANQASLKPDLFSRQAEFAADRERETVVIEDQDYESVCAHVTAVLMDMDCKLQEVNSQLGVISATSASPRIEIAQTRLTSSGYLWRSCAGHSVTVSVAEQSSDEIAVRSSFYPAKPAAAETFRTLLRKSIALQVDQEKGHE